MRTRTKNRMLSKIGDLKDMEVENKDEQNKLESIVQSYFGVLSHCKGQKISDQIERIFWD